MKVRKLLACAAALSMATSAFAMSASASLLAKDPASANVTANGGMFMVKLFAPSEGVDTGIDGTQIGSVKFVLTPVDRDFFEGQIGGGAFMSCGPASVCPADHNWVSGGFWGVIDPDLEIETQNADEKVKLEKIGDYTYEGTLIVDDSNCIYPEVYSDEGGYVQLGIQEWGQELDDIELVSYSIYDKAGNLMVSFDGAGNITSEGESAPAQTEAAQTEAAETEAAETEATEAAPVETTAAAADTTAAAGNVAAATTSSKGSPDTGIADVAAVAGIAVLAGGAVILAKKRK